MAFRRCVYRFNWRCWNTNETKSKHIIFFFLFFARSNVKLVSCPGAQHPKNLASGSHCDWMRRLCALLPSPHPRRSPARPSFLNANCCKDGLIVGWVTLSLLVYTKGIG